MTRDWPSLYVNYESVLLIHVVGDVTDVVY